MAYSVERQTLGSYVLFSTSNIFCFLNLWRCDEKILMTDDTVIRKGKQSI